MGRALRKTPGNIIYHVINRSNGRFALFRKPKDYQAFERILEETKEKYPMRILAYCIMPNHWHLLLKPYGSNDLSTFMRYVTLTHTQRWHAHYHRVGYGHLYQGRFKSFPVEADEYFVQVARYIESNPLRTKTKLAKKAQDWQWGSLWRREYGSQEQKQLLSPWPIPPTKDYLKLVNKDQSKEILADIRKSVEKGKPLGKLNWVVTIAEKLGLKSTLRPRGRPRKS